MIQEVRLPEISDDVTSGDVIKVLVSVGDVVEVDQPLVELETDKAVLEVPSPMAGRITEVLIKAGDTIEIDQVMFKVDADATAPAAETSAAESEDAGRDEVAAVETSVAESEEVAADDDEDEAPETQAEMEPEEAPAPPPRSRPAARPTPAPATSAAATSEQPAKSAPASPSLRRLARELGVDLGRVRGSGPGGRILKDDLTAYARQVVAGAQAPGALQPGDDVTESTKWGPVAREAMSKVRQITARTMTNAWTTIPHVTQFDKVDITEMEAIRKQYSKRLEAGGGKLTMTAILLKVAASALKVFPQFNASLDIENQQVIYKRYYHIGVAVDTDRGLLVPVIRQVDKKNINELSRELNDIAERARNKKITPEELDGGTFTISNLGGIGGTNFSPIVYPPQVAILGVSRAAIEPVFHEGKFEPRLMLPLSVSYDHRIIDGADGARFLRWIVQALEEPLMLALEG